VPLKGLEGKAFVVTGAASGIGLAAVGRLLQEGARVAAVDVDGARLAAAAADLDSDRLQTSRADVSSPQEIARAFEAAVGTFGRLDGLFNNAGIVATRAPLADIDPAEYDRVFDVNVRGTFLGMRAMLAVAARLRAPAAIVNMASGFALRGSPGSGFYAASKAAIISLTRTAAVENAKAGIRVNVLVPGPVDTQLFARHPPEIKQRLLEDVPLRRPGQPSELAGAAAWLLSDESQYVTGAELRVDGGEAA
jgi:NAD(P)-dependent dehydrogenase (short-subunit alcohol dehydrogenase family)